MKRILAVLMATAVMMTAFTSCELTDELVMMLQGDEVTDEAGNDGVTKEKAEEDALSEDEDVAESDDSSDVTLSNRYKYNSDGNVTKYTEYDSDGNVSCWIEYDYDSYGNETMCTEYDADGNVTWWRKTEYEYNASGNITKLTCSYSNGRLDWNFIAGILMKVEISRSSDYWYECEYNYNSDGKLISKTTIEYDGDSMTGKETENYSS